VVGHRLRRSHRHATKPKPSCRGSSPASHDRVTTRRAGRALEAMPSAAPTRRARGGGRAGRPGPADLVRWGEIDRAKGAPFLYPTASKMTRIQLHVTHTLPSSASPVAAIASQRRQRTHYG
jgi:hypothetical protein